jgi:hypothetical protein
VYNSNVQRSTFKTQYQRTNLRGPHLPFSLRPQPIYDQVVNLLAAPHQLADSRSVLQQPSKLDTSFFRHSSDGHPGLSPSHPPARGAGGRLRDTTRREESAAAAAARAAIWRRLGGPGRAEPLPVPDLAGDDA